MDKKGMVRDCIEKRKDGLIGLSESIWEFAELGFGEDRSAAVLEAALESEGFSVRKGLAGIETAFCGSYGSGQPVVAILGEYDALPDMSQVKASPVKEKLVPGGNGHGCGHNLLGVGSLAGAVAAKEFLKASGLPGTIRYYGCPGEEYGCGKTFMVREGCFKDVDLALCWHPADITSILGMGSLANLSIHFRFKGKAAHAASAPQLGRSALDAVELMNVGANYLREHIPQEARLHYAITNPGGSAPNVVQAEAESFYYVRAPKVAQAMQVYERLCDVARGAALMTGTECEIRFGSGISDYVPNKALGEILWRSLDETGAPDFSEEARQLAVAFHGTLTKAETAASLAQIAAFQGQEFARSLEHSALYPTVMPFVHVAACMPGSTDVGDVSQVVPTAQILCACTVLGTVPHSWQFVAQADSPIGHQGMLTAGRALGLAAIEALTDPSIAERAKKEFREKVGDGYVCPIPKEIGPDSLKVS